ncbi:hypothetical protein [Microbacterium sp. 22242]|uniref:hypothetical protein n=1 Tax=Microbacterium sp. 22242 TaxID=3453896 RepID=UPI003F8314B3
MPEAPAEGGGARQRVVRVRGSRRAKLTPAPGTTPEPAEPSALEPDAPEAVRDGPGPNDDRLRRDVPPHY